MTLGRRLAHGQVSVESQTFPPNFVRHQIVAVGRQSRGDPVNGAENHPGNGPSSPDGAVRPLPGFVNSNPSRIEVTSCRSAALRFSRLNVKHPCHSESMIRDVSGNPYFRNNRS